MPLININADLSGIMGVLERIASSLERLSPPILDALIDPSSRKRGLESLTYYGDNDKTWLKQNFQSLIQERGLPEEEAESMLSQALLEYEELNPEENPK